MSRHLRKAICLLLASAMAAFTLTSCAAAGNTDVSSSDSDNGGLLGGTQTQKEGIITEEQKMGRTADGMLGASGTKVSTYSGYLGYGYNILESDFYNYKDIKTGHPIIDMDAMAKAGSVYVENKTSRSVEAKTFISSSAREYSQDVSVSANVKSKIGFTGSFKASFKMDRSSQMNSSQKLITTQCLLEAQNDYIMDSNAALLAAHATDSFKTAVATSSPEELIATYGTHVLTNIALGGRFDLNYLYTRSETSTSTDINVSASASYSYVSGSTTADVKTKKKEIEDNSKIIIRTFGGSLTVNPTSIDEAVGSYKEWSSQVDQGAVSFVNASEVVSLWELIAAMDVKDAAVKSAAVKKYFDDRVDQISGEFKDSVNAEYYISELFIGYGSSQAEAKTMLRNKGVLEGHIVNLDLNKGAGGNWIYLGYKTSAVKEDAITGIVADYYGSSKSSNITYKNIPYTILPVDLNRGSGGDFIYMYYTRNTGVGSPIKEIKYQDNNTFQYGNADGYSAVICVTNKEAMDMNRNAGGDYIYLWFKRA